MAEKIPLYEEILLTIPQAAALLHTRTDIIRSYISAGLIKPLRLGEVKIRRAELDRFLREAEGYDLKDPYNIKEFAL